MAGKTEFNDHLLTICNFINKHYVSRTSTNLNVLYEKFTGIRYRTAS